MSTEGLSFRAYERSALNTVRSVKQNKQTNNKTNNKSVTPVEHTNLIQIWSIWSKFGYYITSSNQGRVLECTHPIPKGIYCKRVAPSSTISVESAPPFTAASEILGCYTANDPKWAKNSVLNRTEQKTIRISMNRKQRSEF